MSFSSASFHSFQTEIDAAGPPPASQAPSHPTRYSSQFYKAPAESCHFLFYRGGKWSSELLIIWVWFKPASKQVVKPASVCGPPQLSRAMSFSLLAQTSPLFASSRKFLANPDWVFGQFNLTIQQNFTRAFLYSVENMCWLWVFTT